MNQLFKRIASLSPDQLKALEEKIKELNIDISGIPVTAHTRENPIPLSYAQRRLWLSGQIEYDSSSYNMLSVVKLEGALNVEALERSLNVVVMRHESLRTVFDISEGEPVQKILPQLSIKIDIHDISSGSYDTDYIENFCKSEGKRSFDLTKGPLIRASLLVLGENRYILVVNVHHIVSDGWSAGVQFRELIGIYRHMTGSGSFELPQLSVQYADYAFWQNHFVRDMFLYREINYWRNKLKDAPAAVNLAYDYPRPATQTFNGLIHTFAISNTDIERLNILGANNGFSLFMVLLAAFKVLLYKYTGQSDIVVGSPVAGRIRPEIENLIGLFINILPMRTQICGQESFIETVKRVSKTALEAFSHQNIPFERVVNEVCPKRDKSYIPFMQVLFILQNTPPVDMSIPGLKITPLRIHNDTAKTDLTVELVSNGEGFECIFEYNSDIFAPATIKRMGKHYLNLLKNIIANPLQTVDDLQVMDEEEKSKILYGWNKTERQYDFDIPIHKVFEKQVEENPDNIAFEYEDESLTFYELNEYSNQIAHYLRQSGVKPEKRVGILMDRCPDAMASMLGILKAGGAFVALDYKYPKERISYMIEDSGIDTVITKRSINDSCGLNVKNIIELDYMRRSISGQPKENLDVGVTTDNLAYVIYTSGSTGKPKGVLTSHKSALNRFYWMWEKYPFDSQDICCQKTSLNFVDSIWEIFGPLLKGITNVIIPDEVLKDTYKFIEALRRNNITRIVLVPSLLSAILSICDKSEDLPQSIKYWTISGEALSAQLYNRLLEVMPAGSMLINLYGSSEVSADVTCFDSRENGNKAVNKVPIGRPISNIQIYILDKRLKPVPIGVPGEIYVAGIGLARGYHNRPELTSERFVLNPFNRDSSNLMFKTGDIGRYLNDGNIEYIGRSDHQVKIRGMRVDLEEVEQHLSSHKKINHAVVIPRETKEGSKALCAFIIPDGEISLADIRSYLTEKLPDYMIPSFFYRLQELPLSPNGKVDRSALLNVAENTENIMECESEYAAPENDAEKILADVWESVLCSKRIGVHDNFFELGGDSIKSTLILARLRKHNLTFDIRDLFKYPTIRQLQGFLKKIEDADKANGKQDAHHSASGVKHKILNSVAEYLPYVRQYAKDLFTDSAVVEGLYPLTPTQERMLFYSLFYRRSGFYFECLTFDIKGKLDVKLFEFAMNELVSRHDIFRTNFIYKNTKIPLQYVLQNKTFNIHYEDISNMDETEMKNYVCAFIENERRKGFDLIKEALMRTSVFRLGEDRYSVVWCYHHILMDGWSMGLATKELLQIYWHLLRGEKPALEQPYQYVSLLYWMEARKREGAFEYWQSYLKDYTYGTALHKFERKSQKGEYVLAESSCNFNAEITDKIKSFSQRNNITQNTFFKSIWGVVLQIYSRSDDVIFGAVVSGRPHEIDGVDKIIGLFVNVVLSRIRCRGNDNIIELMTSVQKESLASDEYAYFPLMQIQEAIGCKGELIDHVFVYENFPVENEIRHIYGEDGLPFTVDNVRFHEQTNYNLNVIVLPGDEFVVKCSYNLNAYDRDFIEGMLRAMECVINMVLLEPDQEIKDIKGKIYALTGGKGA